MVRIPSNAANHESRDSRAVDAPHAGLVVLRSQNWLQTGFTAVKSLGIFIAIGLAPSYLMATGVVAEEGEAGTTRTMGGDTRNFSPQMGESSISTVDAERHNDLYRRGIALIDPHIFIQDRKPSEGKKVQADLQAGIGYLNQALTIYPTNWAALWYRGKAYQALGDHQRAYESFHMAYSINQTNVDVGRELGLECIDTGRFAEGVAVNKAIVQISPKDAGLRANLAVAFLLDGQTDAAGAAVAEALLLDPKDEITKGIRNKIEEVRRGKRPQPKTVKDLVK